MSSSSDSHFRLLNALRGQSTFDGVIPKEYQDEKSKVSGDFFRMIETPEVAARITVQPIDRFPLDAAIIFSDILIIPRALGMEVVMKEKEGPVFVRPLKCPDDIQRLKPVLNPSKTWGFLTDAIQNALSLFRHRVPLIGFCGAPWTLMAYMIEHGSSHSYDKARAWLYQYPSESHQLLQMLTDACVDLLCLQFDAGAQALQVFDSSAGVLSSELFTTFSLPYLKQIVDRVKQYSLSKYKKKEQLTTTITTAATMGEQKSSGDSSNQKEIKHNPLLNSSSISFSSSSTASSVASSSTSSIDVSTPSSFSSFSSSSSSSSSSLLNTTPIPMIIFPPCCWSILQSIASETVFDAISVDWVVTSQQVEALRILPNKYRSHPLCIQGNLDPAILYGDEKSIRSRVRAMLESFATCPGYIANLGHGVLPDHSPDAVACMVDEVHRWKRDHVKI